MEAKLVPQAGYQLETMHVAGFQRKLTLKNIRRNIQAMYYLAVSQPRARKIVKQFRPDIAIGTGGYVAGPDLACGGTYGNPCVIHEQNAFPGVTNKMLSKEVSHVMLTVEKALDYLPSGLPVYRHRTAGAWVAFLRWIVPQHADSLGLTMECASSLLAEVLAPDALTKQWRN